MLNQLNHKYILNKNQGLLLELLEYFHDFAGKLTITAMIELLVYKNSAKESFSSIW